MSHVRRFDHVGLTVADLDVVTAFFVALGLEVEGRTFVEGEFLDTVCGIPDSRTEIVMLKPPGDGTRLELSSFVRPDSVPGSPAAMANELGLRNVAFEVNDLQAAVDWAATEGYGLVGGIGEDEGAWRMAYVRGHGGIRGSLGGSRGPAVATGPVVPTASSTPHQASMPAARPCRPSPRPSGSPPCSAGPCPLPPASPPTGTTSPSSPCSGCWGCGYSRPPARTSAISARNTGTGSCRSAAKAAKSC